jgi:hypothetical protein
MFWKGRRRRQEEYSIEQKSIDRGDWRRLIEKRRY